MGNRLKREALDRGAVGPGATPADARRRIRAAR
jgi:hypothetical protein